MADRTALPPLHLREPADRADPAPESHPEPGSTGFLQGETPSQELANLKLVSRLLKRRDWEIPPHALAILPNILISRIAATEQHRAGKDIDAKQRFTDDKSWFKAIELVVKMNGQNIDQDKADQSGGLKAQIERIRLLFDAGRPVVQNNTQVNVNEAKAVENFVPPDPSMMDEVMMKKLAQAFVIVERLQERTENEDKT